MIPLYCFRLDESTGQITKEVIADYHTVHPYSYNPNRVVYKFRSKRTGCDVKGENIDKFVNWKVYTFTDDIEKVRKIILENLVMRHTQAQIDVDRYASVIKKLGGLLE